MRKPALINEFSVVDMESAILIGKIVERQKEAEAGEG
jgi:hypothetical protein